MKANNFCGADNFHPIVCLVNKATKQVFHHLWSVQLILYDLLFTNACIVYLAALRKTVFDVVSY